MVQISKDSINRVAKFFCVEDGELSYSNIMDKYYTGEINSDELKLANEYFRMVINYDKEDMLRARECFFNDFGPTTLAELLVAIDSLQSPSSFHLSEEYVDAIEQGLKVDLSPVISYISTRTKENNDPCFKKMV